MPTAARFDPEVLMHRLRVVERLLRHTQKRLSDLEIRHRRKQNTERLEKLGRTLREKR